MATYIWAAIIIIVGIWFFYPDFSKEASSQTSSNLYETEKPKQKACKYSCTGPDKDCADFSSHADAQRFFECCGFTATNDPMRLDGRGVDDGLACESI